MKCLITDDSKVTRSILKKIMLEFGFDVIEAEDGVKAIETLACEVIDLCLVDWNMPTMNGTEMIQTMRTHPHWKDIPAILVTDETDEDRINSAIEAGAQGFLAKPFKSHKLAIMIKELGLDI